ncbi:MAG: TRAP transporter large permease [Candidatus Methylomirabilales bacterium]
MIASLLIGFVVLAICSVPVAVSLGLAVVVAVKFFSPFPLIGLVQRMVTGIDSFVLLAIPFFMLTGRLMNQGGITDRLFDFARALVGPVRGGLAHANVLASMIFAGMSGSAVADAGGLGMVEIKAMTDQGYRKEFAAAVTVASSTIGPIIPPSIPMVIYGAMAEVSVGRLFLGGVLPGLLMGVALMVFVYLWSFREALPKDERYSLRRIRETFAAAFLPLLTPVILIGGIVTGVFTPTEAAAVAAMYAFFLSFVVYRTVHLADIPGIIVETLITTAVVTFIISTTSGFSWLLIVGKIGKLLVEFVTATTQSPAVVLLVVNLALLVLGCLMEAGVLLILLTPLLVPLMTALGVDLVHFGVLMVLNLMIGVATPPVGMCLFVVSEAAEIKLETLMWEVVPQILPLLAVLFLITYVPQLVLVVPQWLMPVR